MGDTNRTVSETPMNQASTRSHCIFTLHIEARKVRRADGRQAAGRLAGEKGGGGGQRVP